MADSALSVCEQTERLYEELDLLQNVYTDDEVSIKYHAQSDDVEMVVMSIHPATAGNVDEQYVCLNLHVQLPPQYPDECPLLVIKNPRGLSENEISRLEKTLKDYIVSERGNPVLMQLFELARDTLTNSNVPHGDCSICLCDFLNTERQFIRTHCYHYFHSSCIGKYKAYWDGKIKYKDEQTTALVHREEPEDLQFRCPDCRNPISVPEDLPISDEVDNDSYDYRISDAIRIQQKQLSQIFCNQQAKGGIIDLEQEKMKYRLPTSSTPPPPPTPQVDAGGLGEDAPEQEVESAGIVTVFNSLTVTPDPYTSSEQGRLLYQGSHNKSSHDHKSNPRNTFNGRDPPSHTHSSRNSYDSRHGHRPHGAGHSHTHSSRHSYDSRDGPRPHGAGHSHTHSYDSRDGPRPHGAGHSHTHSSRNSYDSRDGPRPHWAGQSHHHSQKETHYKPTRTDRTSHSYHSGRKSQDVNKQIQQDPKCPNYSERPMDSFDREASNQESIDSTSVTQACSSDASSSASTLKQDTKPEHVINNSGTARLSHLAHHGRTSKYNQTSKTFYQASGYRTGKSRESNNFSDSSVKVNHSQAQTDSRNSPSTISGKESHAEHHSNRCANSAKYDGARPPRGRSYRQRPLNTSQRHQPPGSAHKKQEPVVSGKD